MQQYSRIIFEFELLFWTDFEKRMKNDVKKNNAGKH